MARRWSNRPWRPGAALAAWLLVAALARADVPKLQPHGYTNDYAGVLSAGAVTRANALAAEVDHKTGAQMAVVIVKSLDGTPIEDYANTLARRWGIGHKDNRGVLLLLVTQEHRDRIEVGYGLEPILPDGKVGGILRDLRPFLRQGNYDDAVLQALNQMAGVIAQAAGVTLDTLRLRPPAAQFQRRYVPPAWVSVAIFFIFWGFLLGLPALFILPLLIGRRGGSSAGGGWGGGGGSDSGGSSDSGGFGGGDFGGGGASSNW
ncbi:MAG TPA: TPM domain-containing protein [Bryobacterales bacterium]|nr:TPM domain-containing protein [Bryobacterales bacterium]